MKQTPQTQYGTPPTIGLEVGKGRLETMRNQGKELIAGGRVSDEDAEMWANITLDIIRQTFGSRTPHASTFRGPQAVQFRGGYAGDVVDYSAENARDVKRQIGVLDGLMKIIDTQISFSQQTTLPQPELDFWSHLHPDVVQHCKPRYDAGHFADAVETGMKHVNEKVKTLVKRKTGDEYDGATLMNRALSPANPILTLDDLSTESGKNVQQGYMQIFAGSMTGIRNPKAHGILNISSKRAMHHLFLISLLLGVLDERVS